MDVRHWMMCSVAVAAMMAPRPARADEGMWLFNDLPVKHLQEKYDFTPSEEWAKHVMLSSVRFNSGGSASFVSADGLVLTNHHVAADTLHKVSTPEHNYVNNGFYAKTYDDEIAAPDLELNQLVSVEDVTDRVNKAVKKDMSPNDAFLARRAVMAEIESESLEKTKLRSDVITLYGGGKYHLYRYKKYTDVRLVWAPELGIAFFGGDPDNFEYPRYCLDATLFRVYEDGKPAKIEHFLKFSNEPIEKDQLVFVSGNPGRTDRIQTMAALEFRRDRTLPFVRNVLRRREIMLQQYGNEGEEAERRARDDLFGVQNSRKALGGMLAGLQDPSLMEDKRQQEQALREKVGSDKSLVQYADAWEKIEEAQQTKARLYQPYYLLEQEYGFQATQFDIARTLLRMAQEDEKPNAERLSEYGEQGRESLLQELNSPAPIYNDLQEAKLADSLALLVEVYGGDDPLVLKVLDGKGPHERAAELIQGTRLGDVEYRKQLADGGLKAIESSDDPMLALARLVDPAARAVRKEYEQVAEIERQAYAQIANALFAVRGTGTYPDATFTLRLAFGTVSGYQEGDDFIPPWTTMGGAFDHEKAHGKTDPWELPQSWHKHREDIDGDTPFNFVSTADIIGGNSGSPVINRDGELVGLIFDGNIQSLTANYVYTDEQSRAVSVCASAIVEALDSIYGAERIVKEIRGSSKSTAKK